MTVANVITGSFGAGKTTAIRWLMSRKPEHELWVVILNEFTDAGIDALSVAESARGETDDHSSTITPRWVPQRSLSENRRRRAENQRQRALNRGGSPSWTTRATWQRVRRRGE